MSVRDLPRLFALAESRAYAERVAAAMDTKLAQHEERAFEDGECKLRPLENVRDRQVCVIQSLYGEPGLSVHDKFMRLLLFIGALKDSAAREVTAVLPYLCYARKDRRTKPRDPVATRHVACLLEAAGVDRVVTLDVHNLAAYENAFRCGADHLEARGLFADWFAARVGNDALVVVSPDVGGVKRAEALRQTLERKLQRPVGSAFLEKYRSAGVVSGQAVIGDVKDKVAIIVDDLISTGGTLARGATACRQRGAKVVYAAATHGIFVCEAARAFAGPDVAHLVITDTIPPFRLDPALVREKVTVLDTAPLVAEAIQRIHSGGSLAALLE